MKYWTIDIHTREVLEEKTAAMKGGIYHVPSGVLRIEPLPKKQGFAVVAFEDLSGSEYIEDHRGKTFYHKLAKYPLTIEQLGAVSSALTELVPATRFDQWDGSQWVTDTSAKFIAEYDQVDNTRRNLYTRTVDPIVIEAQIKKLQGLAQEAQDYEQQALALRAKIQAEHPYPVW